MKPRLNCLGSQIVYQEVPNEISIAFAITGCPHRCEGCHSPELRENIGIPLVENIEKILYYTESPPVTCVCFMGGDQNQDDLIAASKIAHEYGYKVCLYSGLDDAKMICKELMEQLDYLKIGSYQKDKGPLNKRTTNQRMFKRTHEDHWVDITNKFWRKEND